MSILSVIIDINSYIPCITFLITCINANSAHRISIIYTSMTILNIMALNDSHSFSGQQSCSFIMIFLDLDCALSKFNIIYQFNGHEAAILSIPCVFTTAVQTGSSFDNSYRAQSQYALHKIFCHIPVLSFHKFHNNYRYYRLLLILTVIYHVSPF